MKSTTKEKSQSASIPLNGDRGYSAHRHRQAQRILAAAEILFTRSGIEGVSMLEISTEAGVQPSTLYQYFKGKDEIALAIAGEIIGDLRSRFQSGPQEQQTGLEKIAALLEMMSTDLETRFEKVRFMAEFDVLYAHRLPADSLQSVAQLGPKSFDELRLWVTAGILDGSLRPELDPETTLHAVLNAAVGMQRRLAALGRKVEQEYGKPLPVLFREAMRVLLLGLSAESTPQTQVKTGSSEAKKPALTEGKPA